LTFAHNQNLTVTPVLHSHNELMSLWTIWTTERDPIA